MDSTIVVVGSSNTDMILQMAHIPRPGETILGGEFSMAAGGKGANQAVGAARAGGQVVFAGPVRDHCWWILFDLVHHRGQLSTYVRPMGGKVPATYGPSGDEEGGP